MQRCLGWMLELKAAAGTYSSMSRVSRFGADQDYHLVVPSEALTAAAGRLMPWIHSAWSAWQP